MLGQHRSTQRKVPYGRADEEALTADIIALASQYALTCSRPRLEAFGGGAHVIDLGARKSIGWTSSQEWLAAALNGEDAHA